MSGKDNVITNNSELSSSDSSGSEDARAPVGESAPPARGPGTGLSETPSGHGVPNPSTSGGSALFEGMDLEEKRAALLSLLQSCGPGPGPLADHEADPPSGVDPEPRATSVRYQTHRMAFSLKRVLISDEIDQRCIDGVCVNMCFSRWGSHVNGFSSELSASDYNYLYGFTFNTSQ